MALILLVVTGTGLLAFALTDVVRRYALQHALLDQPNSRSSHNLPTPRGGGLAIIAAGIIGMLSCAALGLIASSDILTLGLGIVVLAILGWIDDARDLRADLRLVLQIGVAAWTLHRFGGLPTIQIGYATVVLGAWGYVLGTIGIVWGINLFNFMDGIDGLAGSQAMLILCVGAVLLFWRGDRSLGAIAAIFAAASAGFLGWNWPPAKIFMGDVGSGAIGYIIASVAVRAERHGSVPLIVFAILGGVFIADATVTLIRRLSRGESPAVAHRDHAYQRLARIWGAHRDVTRAAAVLTFVLAAVAVATTIRPGMVIFGLVVAYTILGALLVAVETRAPM